MNGSCDAMLVIMGNGLAGIGGFVFGLVFRHLVLHFGIFLKKIFFLGSPKILVSCLMLFLVNVCLQCKKYLCWTFT